ncbi:MAG: gamma-glutamylcyclotransferase [Bdellovibrio sp.]|nr:gamma-glutamylcyclotransferase [Bdellovibrio sp.]
MRKWGLLFLSWVIWLASSIAMAGQDLILGPDQVALIGYGSLMSRESMSRSLGHPYEGPVLAVSIAGYQRKFDVAMPNQAFYEERNGEKYFPEKIAYLNLSEVKTPGAAVNAMVFVINKSELESFDRREWIYHRHDMASHLQNLNIKGGQAIAYIGNPEYLVKEGDTSVAIRKTYLDIIEQALSQQSENFAKKYRESTSSSSFQHIQDMKLPAADPFGYNKAANTAVGLCSHVFAVK